MKLSMMSIMILTLYILTGCTGNNDGIGAGHWFHILFIILPVGITLYLMNKKLDDLQDSITRLSDRLSNISSRSDKDNRTKKSK